MPRPRKMRFVQGPPVVTGFMPNRVPPWGRGEIVLPVEGLEAIRLSDFEGLDQGLVIVSHDWDFVAQTTSKFYSIENGRIVKLDKGRLHRHLHYHPGGDIPHDHPNIGAD